MRPTDRLFQIVQLLRARPLTTGQWLASELGVSVRTLYRDIQHLQVSGVPIEGEAGVGYRLRYSLDLPPLQFTQPELEALRVASRLAQSWTDEDLARSARSALAKIEAVLPAELHRALTDVPMFVPGAQCSGEMLRQIRHAIRDRKVLELAYQRADGEHSCRQVWPLGLFCWPSGWTLTGWCQLRQAFRSFRLDRMQRLQVLPDCYPSETGKRLTDYLHWLKQEYGLELPADWFAGS